MPRKKSPPEPGLTPEELQLEAERKQALEQSINTIKALINELDYNVQKGVEGLDLTLIAEDLQTQAEALCDLLS